MRVDDLCKFIREREAIRLAKEAGETPWWTQDEILRKYSFCNIHREDDRVTRYIAKQWRKPYQDEKEIWFAMIVARLFNLPKTLYEIDISRVLEWKPERVRGILKELRKHGPIFNGAYIVSTNGKAMDKVDYIIDCVLGPLWVDRKKLRPEKKMLLAEYFAKLIKYDGLGSFMAGQVIADLKYIEPLQSAADWHTWATPGPGSRRGLNRVCERPIEAPWPPDIWLTKLQELLAVVNKRYPMFHLHAQDLQNCLCEFDKYERVRLGEGAPKKLYHYEES